MNKLHCYTRVSTTRQKRDGTSLEQQKVEGEKVSKKLGLKFVHVNEGSRSSTRDYRDKLEELKDDIRNGKVKNIWCLERSRMFRDSYESMEFRVNYLDLYDVTLYEGDIRDLQKVEVSSIEETFIYDVMTRTHQMMNETNTKRFLRGKRYKLIRDKEQGVFLGQTILFGYKNVNKKWKVDKRDSKIVQMIFDEYENGKSIMDIKNKLDLLGIETRRTKSGLWNIETIRRMLKNKTYTGLHKIELKSKQERDLRKKLRKERVSFNEIEERTKKYHKDREVHHIKVDKIISSSQFRRVQMRLVKEQKKITSNSKHESLFSNHMICECGEVIGSRVKNYVDKRGFTENTKSYYCVSKSSRWKKGEKSHCQNKKSMNMEKTDSELLKLIKETVSDSSILKEKFKTQVLGKKDLKEEELEERRKSIEDKIQRIQSEIENIEERLVELIVSSNLGQREKKLSEKITKRYEKELELRESEILECEEQLSELDTESSWIDWIEEHGKDLDIQTKNFKSQKEFLDKTIESIVVKSVMGKDRNKKTVQIGHKFDINFKLNLVDDYIKYKDEKKKSKGYNVVEGRNVLKTRNLDVGTTKGRKKKVVENVEN